MDYDELWETTMNPATRTLLQVTLDDAALADEIFSPSWARTLRAAEALFRKTPKTSDSWISRQER